MFKRIQKKPDAHTSEVTLDIVAVPSKQQGVSDPTLAPDGGEKRKQPKKKKRFVRFFQKKRQRTKGDVNVTNTTETDVASRATKKKTTRFSFRSLFIRKLSTKEQTLFAKRLSFLIGSGVPILDSLHVLSEQTTSKSMHRILPSIIDDVQNGRFLSAALGRFERHFGEFAINIIKVGETSGVLGQNLKYLAAELEKRSALKRKVISALVYPVFVTLATLGVTVLLMTYIFPRILPIFSSVDVALPLTTRMLIAVSTFFASYGLLALGVLLIVCVVAVFVYRLVPAVHIFIDRLFLKIPISGRIMQYFNMANSMRTFGLLLKSGSTIVEALETTAETTRNLAYQRALLWAVEHVQRGEKVSTHFMQHKGIFPILVGHMIAIGERTGNLSDTLVYLSELYEEEVDTQTKNLSNAVEPILMLLMGVLVGFVAISVISPIYEITQTISNQI